jgi:putative acetyltransferase
LPERADFRDADVQRLIAALDAELEALYDRPDQEKPAADAFDGAVFVVVRDGDGAPLSCGGLKPHEPGVGEIKRMYTVPEARGRGLAREVLDALVAFAVEDGYERLILETGIHQPAAIHVYETAGWERIALFAPYEHEPDSVCFGLTLGQR